MTENPYESPGDVILPTKSVRRWLVPAGLVIGILLILLACLLPTTRRAREAALRTQCKNNLKNIAMALHNYSDEHGGFPPAYTVDADGNKLHSWRTLILPHLEEKELYESIDLTKPWNHPANAAAFTVCPEVFRCPSSDIPENFTSYLGAVGVDRCLHPIRQRTIDEITDGTANTLLVVEASSDAAVHWMSPIDLDEEFTIGSHNEFAHQGGTQAAQVDGSVRFLSSSMDVDILSALMSIAGEEDLQNFDF